MTTVATDLAEWLLARIADDEAVARAVSVGVNVFYGASGSGGGGSSSGVVSHGGVGGTGGSGGGGRGGGGQGSGYLPGWSRARVLAECKAKRALIADLLEERHEVVDGDCWFTCSAATEARDGGETCDDARRGGECDCGRDFRVRRRVALLALPYANHPDYDESWRP
jgi:hypothetical protein